MNGERNLLSFKGKALINLAVPRIYQLSSHLLENEQLMKR